MGPHISIKGEHVLNFLGFPVTNSILTTLLVLIGFYFLASYYYNESRKKDKGLFYYGLNGALRYLHDLFHTVLHNKTNTFFALLMSFFFFILLNNWSGLIPGVGSLLIKEPQTTKEESMVNNNAAINEDIQVVDDHGNIVALQEATDDHGEGLTAAESKGTTETEGTEETHEIHKVPLLRGGTADLNTTVALALISVFITQFFGFKYLGTIPHLKKYFNFCWNSGVNTRICPYTVILIPFVWKYICRRSTSYGRTISFACIPFICKCSDVLYGDFCRSCTGNGFHYVICSIYKYGYCGSSLNGND